MEEKQTQQIDSPITSWNLQQRIIGIMSELHYIQKEDKTVNGQYRFVSHDQVVSKVQRMLVKYRITTVPTVHEIVQDGNCTRIKLNVTFLNADTPADNFTVQFPGYGIDGGGTSKDGRQIPVGDKGPGKAISYAYKYTLLKIFNLETGEDTDNDTEVFYEPPKCQEFDSIIPVDMSEKDKAKMLKFLAHSSLSLRKHVEDVKREAVARPEDFMKAFKNWKPKKDD